MNIEHIQNMKQRFRIIGNAPNINRAIDVAIQVATTDLSVLITGESGVGKDVFPRIIHDNSLRKNRKYLAVNCGAIPEGTIDSELFGHVKGSFTGAITDRDGYFAEADGGTIFLDEVAELPLSTQARLLRVLESGEYIKVGSSTVERTQVRVVAATNVDLAQAIADGRFREDLFYRLSTIPIMVPPLRERGTDALLLFRKFAQDCAEKYHMPVIKLTEDAGEELLAYNWPGNIRQLKNITEQISIMETQRVISAPVLRTYLPQKQQSMIPMLLNGSQGGSHTFKDEREILYKVLFDMRNDMALLKQQVQDLLKGNRANTVDSEMEAIHRIYDSNKVVTPQQVTVSKSHSVEDIPEAELFDDTLLSLDEIEKDAIQRALQKHGGKRKNAAEELNISERTLYRKIKDYRLDEKK